MKVGIVICTDDRDTCFLAIRYAAFHLLENKSVHIHFVDSGLNFDHDDDENYNLRKLLEDFSTSGGTYHRNGDRDILQTALLRQFGDLTHPKQIENISHNDKIMSIMTRDVYIRKFT